MRFVFGRILVAMRFVMDDLALAGDQRDGTGEGAALGLGLHDAGDAGQPFAREAADQGLGGMAPGGRGRAVCAAAGNAAVARPAMAPAKAGRRPMGVVLMDISSPGRVCAPPGMMLRPAGVPGKRAGGGTPAARCPQPRTSGQPPSPIGRKASSAPTLLTSL